MCAPISELPSTTITMVHLNVISLLFFLLQGAETEDELRRWQRRRSGGCYERDPALAHERTRLDKPFNQIPEIPFERKPRSISRARNRRNKPTN